MRKPLLVVCCLLAIAVVVVVGRGREQTPPLPVRAFALPPEQSRTVGNPDDYLLNIYKAPRDLTVGVFSPNLCVSITNNLANEAIVLRAVYWANYRDDERLWLTERYGGAWETKDGRVLHDLVRQCYSGLGFECGLILPGEHQTVLVPMTPQPGGEPHLVIRYATVSDWRNEVLLCIGGDKNHMEETYAPVTDAMIRARKGAAGGDSVVRCTCKSDAEPLLERELVVPVKLPLRDDPGNRRTGGLSAEAAAKLAGLDPAKNGFLSFYREPLGAWFFVRYDRWAVALRSVKGKWERVAMPAMDWTAPDEFCKAETSHGQSGAMLLAPDVFHSILDVSLPTETMGWLDPGPTMVGNIWPVLERAKAKRIDLRLLKYNLNGLVCRRILSAGVALDPSGLWIDPKIKPIEEGGHEKHVVGRDGLIH